MRACAGNAEFGRLVDGARAGLLPEGPGLPALLRAFGRRFSFAVPGGGGRSAPRPASAAEFAQWFRAFLPSVDLEITRVKDVTDGKLWHLAGLNLSRAWMLEGILSKLPPGDARREPLSALAAKLRQAGLESITGEHYEGGHWLGSFAVYLVSGRGLR